MTSDSYQQRKNIIHDLTVEIDELMKDNAILRVQLKSSEENVANLRLEVVKLENGTIEPVARLEDAHNEIGRLGMVLKHQTDNLDAVNHLPPYREKT